MQDYLIDLLECPVCHAELNWTITEHRGDRIEEGEARCSTCEATYPIREGISLFLTPDLPRHDLWGEAESNLSKYLRENPEIERQLMETPLHELPPADQMFRSMVLEERGDFAAAKEASDASYPGVYTEEYLTCWNSQIAYIVNQLAGGDGPVVDLASGLCILVEELVKNTARPIIATDFSPNVLRRDRKHLEFFGLYDRVSLLAFDARRTPFKAGAVQTMTTNLGLANIEDPGALLEELRRAVAGTFLSLSHFLPVDDEENAAVLREFGLEAQLFRQSALEQFAAAGWQVEIANACVGKALPTPKSELLGGASIDGLPVAETEFEWCVLVAH